MKHLRFIRIAVWIACAVFFALLACMWVCLGGWVYVAIDAVFVAWFVHKAIQVAKEDEVPHVG